MVKSFKRITVLVTGANGFIGSHIARRLVYLGARVSIFVEPRISLWRIKDIIDRVKLYRIDITDYEKIKKLIKRIRPVKIYHLAAHVDVDRSVGLIDSMIDVNLKGTMNILKALKTNNIKFDCFINTGTCEEYGDGKTPFLETQRESPVSP
jgi:nucleoside-diphosphate-sugar epimerase